MLSSLESQKTRIMLVDDHPMLRRGLSDLLSMEDDLLPVVQAASGEEALMLAERHELDLILLDLNMPGMDGIETIRALRAAGVDTRIVISACPMIMMMCWKLYVKGPMVIC